MLDADGSLAPLGNSLNLHLFPLPNGEQGVWVPMSGGHYIVNSKGAFVASFKEPNRDNWDGPIDCAPTDVVNGTFYLGMFYGAAKYKLSGGTRTLKSTVWLPCSE